MHLEGTNTGTDPEWKKDRFLSQGSSKKNMEENTIETTDRISMLPDSIVHHILSYLWYYPKSLVRVSVLSKEWFALTASNPFLYFRRNRYRRFSLCKYVEYTMSRFCKQNISAQTLKISAKLLNIKEIEFFERCVDLVIQKGVQRIKIRLDYFTPSMTKLHLPNSLLSASSLTSLILEECELPSSLMIDDVKLKSLRLLELSCLRLDEGMIEYLTKGCPLLEEIYLEDCDGFKTFCVKKHQNLLKVEIISFSTFVLIERIDVEAPNLSYFSFESLQKNVPTMFLDSCKKLTTFCYRGYPLTRFSDFLSNFQFLKNVGLDLFSPVNLKFSNHSLRKIQLSSLCDLDEIDLNAPNLLFFEYCSGMLFPKFTPLSREDSYLSIGCMKCVPYYNSDILWPKKLRKFLEKNNIFKVLKLVIHWELTNVEELKLIQSPPYKLEHVELKVSGRLKKSQVYIDLLDVLLWCFRPQSLTIKLRYCVNKSDVVKFAYKKLHQQEGEGKTNIKFVLISYSVPEQKFSDLNSLLKAVSLGGIRKITFVKEEVVQEMEYANREMSSSVELRNPSVMTEVQKVSPVLVENWITCFRVMITAFFMFTSVLMSFNLFKPTC